MCYRIDTRAWDTGIAPARIDGAAYKGGDMVFPALFSRPVGGSGGIVFILNSNNGGFMMELFCSTALFSTALFAMSFDDFVARCWLMVIFVWLYMVFVTAAR